MQRDTAEPKAEELEGLARLARAELMRRGRTDDDIEDAVEERLEDEDD